MALGSDISDFYGRFAESAFGKLCLVVVAGGGINLSITLASQTVNKLIGINPGSFVHTIAFVALFEGVAVGLTILAVLFVVGLGFGVMLLMLHLVDGERLVSVIFPWHSPRTDVPYKKLTVIMQVLSFLALCGFAMGWVSTEQPSYRTFVEEKARWFLYSFEMYDRAPCTLGEGQRVAFLDGDEVLMATRAEEATVFEVKSCVSGG